MDAGIEAAVAMARTGADIVEVGLPYSDPLMDGPVIQEAVHRALTGGVRVADVLRTVEAVARAGVPALVMTYWNPVDRYGTAAFAADLAAAGGAGLITPDLTPEEAGPWLEAAAANDLDAVFLAAISSSEERIARVAAACRGFVYAASLMGVTGVRDAVERRRGGTRRPDQEPQQPARRGRRGRAGRHPGGTGGAVRGRGDRRVRLRPPAAGGQPAAGRHRGGRGPGGRARRGRPLARGPPQHQHLTPAAARST